MALKIDRALGAVYGESHPDGPWIHDRNLPPGAPQQPLHLRVSDDGRVVGQGQVDGRAQYWTGAAWLQLGPTTGTNVAAFGPNGTVYVSHIDGVRIYDRAGNQIGFRPGYLGSQGIRWVDASGNVVTGDSTYGGDGMTQWTEVHGVRIGQGPDGGVRVRVDGILRWVVPSGWAEFIRVNRKGDTFSICYFTKPTANVRVTATLADLRACPVVGTQPPPIDPPPPPPPPQEDKTMEMPRAIYDTYKAVAEKFPDLRKSANDDDRRELNRRCVSTIRKRHKAQGAVVVSVMDGSRWVCKSEHNTGWVAASKDTPAYVTEDTVTHGQLAEMHMFDMINGSTRNVNPYPIRSKNFEEGNRDAYVLIPEEKDWLEDDQPPPPPPPTDDIPARVDAIEQKLADTLREFAVMRGQFDAMNPTRIVRELAIMRDDMDDLQKLIREIDLGSGVTVDEIIQQVGVNVGRSFSHSHPASLVKK